MDFHVKELHDAIVRRAWVDGTTAETAAAKIQAERQCAGDDPEVLTRRTKEALRVVHATLAVD